MTTTAFDDQFTAEPEHVTHRPYDTAAILRQNIADLELELKQQRERHAAATARLRDQIERVTSEWERAEAELKAAREQEPVAWRDPTNSDPGQGCTYNPSVMNKWPHIFKQALYTRPIPAPAPAVPDGDDFNGATPHLIQCMEALVRLDADGVLVPHGIGRDASKLLSAAANRLRKQPAPSVPEEWRRNAMAAVQVWRKGGPANYMAQSIEALLQSAGENHD